MVKDKITKVKGIIKETRWTKNKLKGKVKKIKDFDLQKRTINQTLQRRKTYIYKLRYVKGDFLSKPTHSLKNYIG